MKKLSVKTTAATVAGILLFFLFGRFIILPGPVAGTYVTLQYGLLAFVSLLFGPIPGFLAGFFGHLLIDLAGGSVSWSFVFASGFFGLSVGALFKDNGLSRGIFTGFDVFKFNLFQILAGLFCWCILAPVLDIVVYTGDIRLLLEQSLFTCVSNIITTAIFGTLLCAVFARAVTDMASKTEQN